MYNLDKNMFGTYTRAPRYLSERPAHTQAKRMSTPVESKPFNLQGLNQAVESLTKSAPKVCSGALLFFGLLFGGQLLIANSSSDLRSWRGFALGNANGALTGLAIAATGLYALNKNRSDRCD